MSNWKGFKPLQTVLVGRHLPSHPTSLLARTLHVQQASLLLWLCKATGEGYLDTHLPSALQAAWRNPLHEEKSKNTVLIFRRLHLCEGQRWSLHASAFNLRACTAPLKNSFGYPNPETGGQTKPKHILLVTMLSQLWGAPWGRYRRRGWIVHGAKGKRCGILQRLGVQG